MVFIYHATTLRNSNTLRISKYCGQVAKKRKLNKPNMSDSEALGSNFVMSKMQKRLSDSDIRENKKHLVETPFTDNTDLEVFEKKKEPSCPTKESVFQFSHNPPPYIPKTLDQDIQFYLSPLHSSEDDFSS